MEEIWKTIDGFKNYEVSTFGNVRNKKTSRVLKLLESCNGYFKINLWVDGKMTTKLVHRLVAESFIKNK